MPTFNIYIEQLMLPLGRPREGLGGCLGGGGGMKDQLLSPKINFVHVNLYLQMIKFQNSSLHSPSFAKSRIHSCNPLTLSGQTARLKAREGVVGSMGEGAGVAGLQTFWQTPINRTTDGGKIRSVDCPGRNGQLPKPLPAPVTPRCLEVL